MEGGSSVHDTILLLADKKPLQAPTLIPSLSKVNISMK